MSDFAEGALTEVVGGGGARTVGSEGKGTKVATKKLSSIKPTMTVAAYIAAQLEICDKSQAQVAREAGFERPNVITMIKQGHTKLPLEKVVPMARALGVDAVNLWRMALLEYAPGLWAAQELLLKQGVLTENEAEIVEAIREAGGLPDRKILASERGALVRAIKAAVPKA